MKQQLTTKAHIFLGISNGKNTNPNFEINIAKHCNHAAGPKQKRKTLPKSQPF
jgi:hypothetical protein